MTATAEPVPVTRQEIADFKILFPPEVVDRALAKKTLVLMDEQKKVSNNETDNRKT